MNKLAKDAVFTLTLGVPGLVIAGLTFYFIAKTGIIEDPRTFWPGLWLGYAFAGLLWIWPLLTRKDPAKGYDERDLLIFKRAILIAYSLLWLYLVTAAVAIGWLKGEQGVSPTLFLGVIFAGAVLFTLAMSLTTLLQYIRTKS